MACGEILRNDGIVRALRFSKSVRISSEAGSFHEQSSEVETIYSLLSLHLFLSLDLFSNIQKL